MAGKGSSRRPENKRAFDENYDRIFNKKCEEALDELVQLGQELEDYSEDENSNESTKAV